MSTKASERPVAVAITTFRRTQLLGALLTEIERQAAMSMRNTRVLVVDNDPHRSAEPLAADRRHTYIHEAMPGIAAARQAALDAAQQDELLVMIDDDVLPEEGWLAGLVDVWADHAPTVVMGYIRYVWPAESDPWFAAGGFMRRHHHPTGTSLESLSSGSILIDVAAVRTLGVGFDTSLGLAGGEDTAFGRAVLDAGGTILSSAESVACDEIPPDRVTVAFVRRRTIAQGAALSNLSLQHSHGRILRRATAVAGALTRLVAFGSLHVMGRLRRDLRMDAQGKRRMWFAVGRLQGALGKSDPEYARATTESQ